VVEGPSEKEVKKNIIAGKTSIQGKPSKLRPMFAHLFTRTLKPVKKMLFPRH